MIRRALSDPRHFQIITLSLLLFLQVFVHDFSATLPTILVVLCTVLAVQALCMRLVSVPLDLRSPLITGLSLTILLKAGAWWIYLLAAGLAIASKFTLRAGGRHIFNPANLGIVLALLLFPDMVWVSPGQWGQSLFLATILICLAFLVLSRVKAWDMGPLFLMLWTALLFARAVWLGDPLSIPFHQIQSGALLIFAFFMISDPKTIPDTLAGRFIFALAVAITGFILQFEFQVRESLFYALALVCLMRFIRSYLGNETMHVISKLRAAWYVFVPALMLALGAPSTSHAFCGFYVAKAEADLFNKASKVVMARADNRTVITMANDFQGDPEEFAIVIPVPVVLTEKQVNVTENRIIDHLDAYTAPRLVEYFDPDPCQQRVYMEMMRSSAMPMAASDSAMDSAAAKALGVTIEAEYTVGEYDIVILSAKQSDGLQTYLNREGYKLPKGASKVLRSYIKQDMKFFLARVNLEAQAKAGYTYLRPLQVAFESEKFMLPIRLGTLNANGPQDLILYTLTRKGRVETANYRTVKIPSDINVPLFVKDEFGAFYQSMFDTAVQKENMKAVFLEYAWDMAWCDPCAADPLPNEDLRMLGVWWVEPSRGISPQNRGRMIMPPQGVDTFVTRLHVRYDGTTFPEDLVLNETADRQNFQGRYVMNHPWTGAMNCPQGKAYAQSLPDRFEKEAQTLVKLTGWDIGSVREKMEGAGQSFDPSVMGTPKPWWEDLWNN